MFKKKEMKEMLAGLRILVKVYSAYWKEGQAACTFV